MAVYKSCVGDGCACGSGGRTDGVLFRDRRKRREEEDGSVTRARMMMGDENELGESEEAAAAVETSGECNKRDGKSTCDSAGEHSNRLVR